MPEKVILLVLSEAPRADVAAQRMGSLEHLIETGQGTRFSVRAELPTLSRPIYETVHTGLPVTRHGVDSSQTIRRSNVPNGFEIAVQNRRVTAAAAHPWVSKLYNRAPLDPLEDRALHDDSLLIQHGRFDVEDSDPDQDLFLTAARLARRYSPDDLLIHPMGMDYLGDTLGADTPEYRNQARAGTFSRPIGSARGIRAAPPCS